MSGPDGQPAAGCARDPLAASAVEAGRDPAISKILGQVCETTGMGFAAVARVTGDRWIACQVLDKIEFGLNPGDELEIKKTICSEIRQHGQAVVIDTVSNDQDWRMHHVPMLYGFESYASFPIVLANGEFFGTLCAIDPMPRNVSAPLVVSAMSMFSAQIADIISARA